MFVEPVRVHEPRSVLVRVGGDRGQECVFVGHGRILPVLLGRRVRVRVLGAQVAVLVLVDEAAEVLVRVEPRLAAVLRRFFQAAHQFGAVAGGRGDRSAQRSDSPGPDRFRPVTGPRPWG